MNLTGPHPYSYNTTARCRCDDCRAEATKRRKKQRLNAMARENYGAVFPADLVDSRDTVKLVQRARLVRKLSLREIARLTGVGHPTVKKLTQYRAGDQIMRRVESAVLEGLSDDMDRAILPGSHVPVKKSQQIVRSLCAQGWTQSHQADIIENNLEASGGVILHVMRSNRVHTTKEIEDRLLWLAQAVGNRTGPSNIIAVKMRNMGYFPNKHYSMKGDLIVSTLSPDQRAIYERVR